MKRDEFLGQDPEQKIIFAFLFSRNQKAISLFIKYSDEKTLEIAKQTIALHIEPYRVCRRVNILRDYPDDKIKIYP